ncbi:MAG: SDR family NAD(P)-dependent oxidoreductase [Bacteroidales bacterium]|nr:SDR family NAD(P)-dependent oxidoreductase [Bacteroidales bacterium]HOY39099.1 SDR family NAD(P)-dependent oxidoreductase [Bacteroidales bacterium]HQP04821.1 SDR family NAD(P)-dependent oxidoreductase [Bacteroidales bacterium]
MNKIVLITGATAGIGKATAELLGKNGYRIIITGRRQSKLSELQDTLKLKHNCSIISLCFDIRNRKEVDNAIDSLPTEWKDISILVNNAGLAAGFSPFQDCEISDWERMIDTNVKGLLYISKKVIPLIIAQGSGHIVNIGSIAGREVYPNGNVYNATKHAVDALSKAMRIDLLKHNIKVTQIAPGLAETEFSEVRFHGDKQRAKEVYKGFEPLHAEDIADAIHYAITRPVHVNINDMLIVPSAQANAYNINKIIEEEW